MNHSFNEIKPVENLYIIIFSMNPFNQINLLKMATKMATILTYIFLNSFKIKNLSIKKHDI